MSIRIDDAGGSSDTLQANRLPHDQQFVVNALGHDDQVAWLRDVDRALNRCAWSDAGRSLAADSDRHGVNRLLAAGGGNHQFAAAGTVGQDTRTAVLELLLHRAERYLRSSSVRQSHSNRGVRPTVGSYVSGDATDGDGTRRTAEAIVTSNGLLIPR